MLKILRLMKIAPPRKVWLLITIIKEKSQDNSNGGFETWLYWLLLEDREVSKKKGSGQ